jgi:putative ABC transport system permease protein
LFSETLMLCALGCALGVGLGYGGTRFLIAAGYADPQSYLRWQIVAFSAVLALLAALLVSAAPSHRILRGRLLTLREGDRGASAGPGRNNLRRAAMILQVAMSLVLLAGAGLLLESFRRVSGIDPGFAPENLLTMEYRMPPNKYPKPEQQVQFHRLVAERVRAVPGVASATVVMALPFSGNGEQVNFVLLDRGAPERGKEPLAELNRADESYFETMKIPLRQGRVVGAYDTLDAPAVVIINEGMAHRWWPGESPIGRKLRLVRRGDAPPLTVVGVVGDTRHSSLESPQADQIYVSFMQAPNIFGTLVARTAGEPMAMTAAVRGAVWSVDKDQPVWKIRTQESLIDRSFSQRRFLAALLAGFSGLALLLTAVGMYGVIRY